MTTDAPPRTADHPIDPIFLARWSPRAFGPEEISEAELLTLLEAARWAPSAYNSQPWRLVYARRGTPDWERFLGVLNDFNKSWARAAAALVVVVSSETMTAPGSDKAVPSYSHSFDAGAAWANLALQATRSGWFTHGMTGLNHEVLAETLNLPEGHRVEAAIAIGRQGDPATLPEKLAAREVPSGRLPLSQIAFEGRFPQA